jgi:hypothetical protein
VCGEEKEGRWEMKKIIQITATQESDSAYGFLFALTEAARP